METILTIIFIIIIYIIIIFLVILLNKIHKEDIELIEIDNLIIAGQKALISRLDKEIEELKRNKKNK